MSIEVSVILPSYNRYPLNRFTLYSLENQTFDLSEMEVILVDDASTDETHLLQNYQAPFPFRYIRNSNNLGRSKTRNIGIEAAKGSILIFLDAEVIVDPNFVKNHYQRHLSNERLLVTARNVSRVFSFLYPEFNSHQWGIWSTIQESPEIKERLGENRYKKIEQPLQLLFKEDCLSISRIKPFSALMTYEEKIINAFTGDFRLPWISCTTLNHSIRKRLVESVGGFDEKFIGHGLEDYEYGFRLYKLGIDFSYDPNIYVYHQEHPKEQNLVMEDTGNYIYFQQKHPCMDVCLLSLERINIFDFTFMHNIMIEYESLLQQHQDSYNFFTTTIIALLKQIPILENGGKPITRLLETSGINADRNRSNRLSYERDAVEKYGFSNLVKLFDLLVNL